ncbi:hypothetical protein DA075_35510 (plasmid) [Methylobacterium currus]|uniref:DUF2059 domain-containing protein n=1 Tax=Methylobacterium currus TaxID=2051553 RepID=A0A2R4WXD1_9HYPH|nr:hypothetical protein [Methylobacterium currus]AWB26181.1 hypothetical protein DA075_35510 [Methylobacterium currus]
MASLTLALLTALPARRAFAAGAALLGPAAAPQAPAAPLHTVEVAPMPMLALPAPRRPSPLLAAIEEHRSANLAVMQAVRDYVQAREDSAPDERLMLAIASRASDEEAAAFDALMAVTLTSDEDARAATAYFAEFAAETDDGAMGTRLLQRLAVLLAAAA